MKRTPHSMATLFAAFMILALVGQGGVWSYVWCIGEDGHAAVEEATAGGRCAVETLPIDHGGLDLQEEHCGPCLDLSAGLHLLQARSRADLDHSAAFCLLPQADLPPAYAVPVFIRVLSAPSASHSPPKPPTIMAALRTIVLLV